jgi:SAM-dependent methyltransferase
MSYANPAAYERFMGRWSARLAPAFLRFAQVKDGQNLLDVGCGTGVLSRALISSGAAVKVTGVDPAADYLAFAARGLPADRARFHVGSAEALPLPDGAFDAALALLVLQDFDEPKRAVPEMARVTRRVGDLAKHVKGITLGQRVMRGARKALPGAKESPTCGGQLAEVPTIRRIDVDVLTGVFGHIEKDAHQYAGDSVDGVVPIETLSHQTGECCWHDRHITHGDLIFDDDMNFRVQPLVLADR